LLLAEIEDLRTSDLEEGEGRFECVCRILENALPGYALPRGVAGRTCRITRPAAPGEEIARGTRIVLDREESCRALAPLRLEPPLPLCEEGGDFSARLILLLPPGEKPPGEWQILRGKRTVARGSLAPEAVEADRLTATLYLNKKETGPPGTRLVVKAGKYRSSFETPLEKGRLRTWWSDLEREGFGRRTVETPYFSCSLAPHLGARLVRLEHAGDIARSNRLFSSTRCSEEHYSLGGLALNTAKKGLSGALEKVLFTEAERRSWLKGLEVVYRGRAAKEHLEATLRYTFFEETPWILSETVLEYEGKDTKEAGSDEKEGENGEDKGNGRGDGRRNEERDEYDLEAHWDLRLALDPGATERVVTCVPTAERIERFGFCRGARYDAHAPSAGAALVVDASGERSMLFLFEDDATKVRAYHWGDDVLMIWAHADPRRLKPGEIQTFRALLVPGREHILFQNGAGVLSRTAPDDSGHVTLHATLRTARELQEARLDLRISGRHHMIRLSPALCPGLGGLARGTAKIALPPAERVDIAALMIDGTAIELSPVERAGDDR
jgi:hypothetical protein